MNKSREAKTVKKAKLGIMGGTFNPIHYGHLVTAEEALFQFKLDKVIFMPCGRSPHKKQAKTVTAEERYLMTVIATATNPRFLVSRLEINRPGLSYTLDTLEELHNDFSDETEIFFITGADAVLEILTWKQPERLAGYSRFIAATRPGYDLDRFKELADKRPDLPSVHFMEITALAISSTDLRQRIKNGRPIRYLLPDSIAGYIRKKRLYL